MTCATSGGAAACGSDGEAPTPAGRLRNSCQPCDITWLVPTVIATVTHSTVIASITRFARRRRRFTGLSVTARVLDKRG
jgi:hypothetical protein